MTAWHRPKSLSDTSTRSTAPRKKWVWFEESGHFPQWEQADDFHQFLIHTVLPTITG